MDLSQKTGSGFDDIKASALASVLCVTSKTFNIVHTDVVSIYLKGVKNARIGNPCKTNGGSGYCLHPERLNGTISLLLGKMFAQERMLPNQDSRRDYR